MSAGEGFLPSTVPLYLLYHRIILQCGMFLDVSESWVCHQKNLNWNCIHGILLAFVPSIEMNSYIRMFSLLFGWLSCGFSLATVTTCLPLPLASKVCSSLRPDRLGLSNLLHPVASWEPKFSRCPKLCPVPTYIYI